MARNHIQGDSRGKHNVLGGGNIGHTEGKTAHMKVCLILNGYRDRVMPGKWPNWSKVSFCMLCLFRPSRSYVYRSAHHLYSWIKIYQLDVTCFIISLFTAQHVSNVSTSETRWAVNSEIIKQVTSSWSIFIQQSSRCFEQSCAHSQVSGRYACPAYRPDTNSEWWYQMLF